MMIIIRNLHLQFKLGIVRLMKTGIFSECLTGSSTVSSLTLWKTSKSTSVRHKKLMIVIFVVVTTEALYNETKTSLHTRHEWWTMRVQRGRGTEWRWRYISRCRPQSRWAGSNPWGLFGRHQTWKQVNHVHINY